MSRKIFNMNFEWRFHRGEVTDAVSPEEAKSSYNNCKSGNAIGVPSRKFSDADWRVVNLPHDYYAESGFSPENLPSHGYRDRCNAWYRKSFNLDESLKDKHLLLCFEGTAVNAEFYFNGSLMERSFSAYTETVFDITDRAYFGDVTNTLVVYINGLATEGWWYEGAGIYRDVKLYVKDKTHIAHNGVFVSPVLKPNTKNSWVVNVETEIENSNYSDCDVEVEVKLYDKDVCIAQSTSKKTKCLYASKTVINQKFNVSRPKRWDIDNPYLYTAEINVIKDGVIVDTETVRTGFRTYYIDKDKCFILNDKKVFLKGTCNHQDHAGVGVAITDSLNYYRIKLLKEMGTNAYRCSHNLPTKAVLDACDELGLVVMDENRRFETRQEVLNYLEIMVKRDRNHPSVIFYSLFNEEPLQNTEIGAKMYRRMRSYVEHLDNTRIFTGAINGNMEGAGLVMDITGNNYNLKNVEGMRLLHPDQAIFGAENNSAVTTRGCYKTDKEDKQVLSNYDEEAVPWGQTIKETWDFCRKHEYFGGIFVWTGFDYRGEPTPFTWPSVSSQFGIMDTCGFPKDAYYFHKACFTDKPMLHLMPHWNWEKGEIIRVMAVTNCEEVELFLNGKSLGIKKADVCAQPEWQVEFQKGRISAKAYKNGKCVAKDEHRTTGKPYAIKIMPNTTELRNDGLDTSVLNFCVVDKKGRVVPNADNLLKFEIIGDGILRGVGNGNPNSHESDILPQRKLFAGYCQALVSAKIGAKSFTFKVTGDDLQGEEITFKIIDTNTDNYIYSVNTNSISEMSMSLVNKQRPNPLIELTATDFNSFMPLRLDGNSYQADLIDAWRIYRVTPKLKINTSYEITFKQVKADVVEVYANGKQLFVGDNTTPNFQCVFNTENNEIQEIRILIYCDKVACGGLCNPLAIKEIKGENK